MLSLTREGWGARLEAWPCGGRVVENEMTSGVFSAGSRWEKTPDVISFSTTLLPHLPPLAAPQPAVRAFVSFSMDPHGSPW